MTQTEVCADTTEAQIPHTPRRSADFFVIGGGKCGTTTLHDYLARHPALCMSFPKEPCFYSRKELTEDVASWYAGLFENAAENQLCGESSTAYSRWPHTPDVASRIAAVVPDAKFIYVMRHPAERAYSHFAYHMRDGVEMPFMQALDAHPEYIDVSRYMMQIERYLRFFGREAFHFVLFEELTRDPAATLARIEQFLGVEALDLVSGAPVNRNKSGAERHLRRRTVRRLRRAPLMSRLIDVTPTPIKSVAMGFLRRSHAARRIEDSYGLDPMSLEERRLVLDRVHDDTVRLEEFLGVDLSAWKS